jgi:hypothetical protein
MRGGPRRKRKGRRRRRARRRGRKARRRASRIKTRLKKTLRTRAEEREKRNEGSLKENKKGKTENSKREEEEEVEDEEAGRGTEKDKAEQQRLNQGRSKKEREEEHLETKRLATEPKNRRGQGGTAQAIKAVRACIKTKKVNADFDNFGKDWIFKTISELPSAGSVESFFSEHCGRCRGAREGKVEFSCANEWSKQRRLYPIIISSRVPLPKSSLVHFLLSSIWCSNEEVSGNGLDRKIAPAPSDMHSIFSYTSWGFAFLRKLHVY